MASYISWIIALGLVSLFPSTHGFILCKCDTEECQAAKVTECRAEFYCYVSFRPEKPGERKASSKSKMMYGAGSQLFIAEKRGCVPPDQMEMCHERESGGGSIGVISGGFGNLNIDEGGHARPPILQCCCDNWCNTGQELEFTRAEMDGRQFFLNPEVSNLEPGLNFPTFTAETSGGEFHSHLLSPCKTTVNAPLRNPEKAVRPVGATPILSLTQHQKEDRPVHTNDVFFDQWYDSTLSQPPSPPHLQPPQPSPVPSGLDSSTRRRGPVPERDDSYSSPAQLQQQKPQGDEPSSTRDDGTRSPVVLQPLHIAISICFIILMLVAVLLHLVVVLHRRHRRLKRELMKQTQKTSAADQQQQPQTHQWSLAAGSPLSDQPVGQQINLQQIKCLTAPTEQCLHRVDRLDKRSLCLSCPWKRPRSKRPASNVYNDVHSRQTPAMTVEGRVSQCGPHETRTSQTSAPYQVVLTTSSSLPSSFPTPPTLHGFPGLTQQQQQPQQQQQQQQRDGPPQPASYPPHSPDHSFLLNPTKNAYGTGSSTSGCSGNNPSTAESSLPTQSSAVTGWNNINNNVFLYNGLTSAMPTANAERPSLSGSSEACGLTTPDFETRRANVALPPALLGGEGGGPSAFSHPANTTSLALFRSAVPQNETCPLVTPYAQLQLSLSFDQYDTPEQIFDGGNTSITGSASLDGLGGTRDQASSNPTTNSSLLHSYCEHRATGDFGV